MPTPPQPRAILALGRFMSPGDAETLIRALARLFDLDWTLCLVTDSEWSDVNAHETARNLGVEPRIAFARTPDWDAAQIFACAAEPPALDIAVACAFRHGLPVIASADSPGSLITPENGVVCPPGDVEQLSKALRRLIFDTALFDDLAAAVSAAAS